MKKRLLFLFLLVLNGCSLSHLFIGGEVDKVTVVGYEPYMKQHRAYFSRTQLKTIKGGKKYIYLYNAKTNDIGVLLHRKNQYVLYNMSNPKQKPFAINAHSNKSYQQSLRAFKSKGFKVIKSLASVGHTVSASHRRYKGIKTILIEVKEYSQLQGIYQKAIKSYDASKIKRIKTKLPKSLISTYYAKYKKSAKTRTQLLQLKIIADKLDLKAPMIPQKKTLKKKQPTPKKVLNTKIKKEIVKEKTIKEIKEVKEEKIEIPKTKIVTPIVPKKPSATQLYRYYVNRASLSELTTFLSKQTTRYSLSHSKYNRLKRRKVELQEERLFNQGSLEELIAAYKVNKNPKYKKRIMSLMKDTQAE